ncbi:MAG: carboxypeptidase regulatory-like domain-containing protein, partial [bacterium]|nr:carboxypeptidase regulatory-like domain-containing protein [bacterium]
MKTSKTIVLLILIAGIFQVNLFSLISSRIEGVVTDKETGVPIAGAEVYLIHKPGVYNISNIDPKHLCSYKWIKKTDINGFFEFDYLSYSEYFISVLKDGYEIYGPKAPHSLKRSAVAGSIYGGATNIYSVPKSAKGRIHLGEGDIRHLKIELRKEAILEITFTQKTDKGEAPMVSTYGSIPVRYKNDIYGASLVLSDPDDETAEKELIHIPSIHQIGKVTFKNLPGGRKATVFSMAYGYRFPTKKVDLKSGDTQIIHNRIDFTGGLAIHGVILPNNDAEPVIINRIELRDGEFHIRAFIEKNGEFHL